ncbi:MAG: DNA recombination/repair protein RecA, partial [Pseudomonadota bacterium]|nr:DNA recombination/repair protein RecA [Pseudomonadota bacterium]
IVEKSGAWFSYNGQRIGQGRQNAKIFLKENTEVAEEIEQKIRENAGLISEQMLEGAQNEDSDKEAPSEITVAEGESD